jgi:hypothetical protein
MHPGYGQVSICKTGRQLQMVINDNLSLPLEHAHADVFEAWYEIVDQRQEVIFFNRSKWGYRGACRTDGAQS